MTVAIVESEDWLGDREGKIEKEYVEERLLFYKKFLFILLRKKLLEDSFKINQR